MSKKKSKEESQTVDLLSGADGAEVVTASDVAEARPVNDDGVAVDAAPGRDIRPPEKGVPMRVWRSGLVDGKAKADPVLAIGYRTSKPKREFGEVVFLGRRGELKEALEEIGRERPEFFAFRAFFLDYRAIEGKELRHNPHNTDFQAWQKSLEEERKESAARREAIVRERIAEIEASKPATLGDLQAEIERLRSELAEARGEPVEA